MGDEPEDERVEGTGLVLADAEVGEDAGDVAGVRVEVAGAWVQTPRVIREMVQQTGRGRVCAYDSLGGGLEVLD